MPSPPPPTPSPTSALSIPPPPSHIVQTAASISAVDLSTFNAATAAASLGITDPSAVVTVTDLPVVSTLSFAGVNSLGAAVLSALRTAVVASLPASMQATANVTLTVQGGGGRRLLDVSVALLIEGVGSSTSAASAVCSSIQNAGNLHAMANAAGSMGVTASAPTVTAKVTITTVSLTPLSPPPLPSIPVASLPVSSASGGGGGLPIAAVGGGAGGGGLVLVIIAYAFYRRRSSATPAKKTPARPRDLAPRGAVEPQTGTRRAKGASV